MPISMSMAFTGHIRMVKGYLARESHAVTLRRGFAALYPLVLLMPYPGR